MPFFETGYILGQKIAKVANSQKLQNTKVRNHVKSARLDNLEGHPPTRWAVSHVEDDVGYATICR
jgi:hypothetical protein